MDRAEQSPDKLALVEERIRVSKRRIGGEKVRVRTVVDSRQDVAIQTLETERLEVTRKAIDRIVETAPEIRTEGDLTIIPVLEEIAVVETRLLLKEEVHIRRVRTRETAEIPVTLRSQRAVIERLDSEGEAITENQEKEP